MTALAELGWMMRVRVGRAIRQNPPLPLCLLLVSRYGEDKRSAARSAQLIAEHSLRVCPCVSGAMSALLARHF